MSEQEKVDENTDYSDIRRVFHSNNEHKQYNKGGKLDRLSMLRAIQKYRKKNRPKPTREERLPRGRRKRRKRDDNIQESTDEEGDAQVDYRIYQQFNAYSHLLPYAENLPVSVLVYDSDVSRDNPIGVGCVTSFSHQETGDVFIKYTLGINNEYVKTLIGGFVNTDPQLHGVNISEYEWIHIFPNLVDKITHPTDQPWEANELEVLSSSKFEEIRKFLPEDNQNFESVKSCIRINPSTTTNVVSQESSSTESNVQELNNNNGSIQSTITTITSTTNNNESEESPILPPPPPQNPLFQTFPSIDSTLSAYEFYENMKNVDLFQEKFNLMLVEHLMTPHTSTSKKSSNTGRVTFHRGQNCRLKATVTELLLNYPHPLYGQVSFNFSSLSDGGGASPATVALSLFIELYDYITSQGIHGFESFVNYLVPHVKGIVEPPPSISSEEEIRKKKEITVGILRYLLKRIRGVINGYTTTKERNHTVFQSLYFGTEPSQARFNTVVTANKPRKNIIDNILTDEDLGKRVLNFAEEVCMNYENIKNVKNVSDFQYVNKNVIISPNPMEKFTFARVIHSVSKKKSVNVVHLYPKLKPSPFSHVEYDVRINLFSIGVDVVVFHLFNGKESTINQFKTDRRMNASLVRINKSDSFGGYVSNCDIGVMYFGIRPSGYLTNILCKFVTSPLSSIITNVSSTSSGPVVQLPTIQKLFLDMDTTHSIMMNESNTHSKYLDGPQSIPKQRRVSYSLGFLAVIDFDPYIFETRFSNVANSKIVEIRITNMRMDLRTDIDVITRNLLFFIKKFYGLSNIRDKFHIKHNRFHFFEELSTRTEYHQNINFGIVSVVHNWFCGGSIYDISRDDKAVMKISKTYRTNFINFLNTIWESDFEQDEDEDDNED